MDVEEWRQLDWTCAKAARYWAESAHEVRPFALKLMEQDAAITLLYILQGEVEFAVEKYRLPSAILDWLKQQIRKTEVRQ